MAVDPTKIAYSSGWDIDQLIASNAANPTSVGTGNTSLYNITGAVALPEFKVQFKPTGSTFWYDAGTNSTNGTIAGVFVFYGYINGSSIFINTSVTGTARYYVWADKFNY